MPSVGPTKGVDAHAAPECGPIGEHVSANALGAPEYRAFPALFGRSGRDELWGGLSSSSFGRCERVSGSAAERIGGPKHMFE
jgi:hypothetical protein